MLQKLYHHASLPSTMDEAKRLASEGAPEGTIVQAGEQTAGRGRFGNTWTSPKGNLYMTLILRPQVPTRHAAQLSFVVALALADAIDKDETSLKWPNDVLVGGKKIAGILLEMNSSSTGAPDYVLVGTGVNVQAAPEGCAKVGGDVTADMMRDRFFANLTHWYQRWLASGFSDIRLAWLARAHGLHEPITVRFVDRTLKGIFEGIDESGNLLLRQNDGQARAISSGEVHFGRVAP